MENYNDFSKNINKNLTEDNKIFFNNFENYLDEPIYFFGSILRNDFNKRSDIDIAIFTENTEACIYKITSFLKIDKKKIKDVYWKIPKTNRVANGKKVIYKSNEDKNLVVEISIYDIKYKDEILFEYYKKSNLPFHAAILLNILKLLHYDINIIDRKIYSYLKKNILSYGIGFPKDQFIAI